MEGPLTDRARQLGAEIHLVPMLYQGKLRKLWGLSGKTPPPDVDRRNIESR